MNDGHEHLLEGAARYYRYGQTTAASNTDDALLSVRIYNPHILKYTGFDAMYEAIERATSLGCNVLYTMPFFQALEQAPEGKQAGSPYATKQYVLDKRLNDGQLADNETTEKAVKTYVAYGQSQGLKILADLVPNHIACDSPIFDPTQWQAMQDDAVLGQLATALLQGAVVIDDVFAPSTQKRCPDTAGDWTDVREIRLETPEQIAQAATHFFEPLVEYFAKMGFDGLRVDSPSMLPSEAWQVLHPIIQQKFAAQGKAKPLLYLETVGTQEVSRDKNDYAHALAPDVLCYTNYLWAITDSGMLPQALIQQMANHQPNTDHESKAVDRFFELRDALGKTITFPTSHDVPENDPHTLMNYIKKHVADEQKQHAMYRQLLAVMALPNTGLMITDGAEYGRQPKELFAPDHVTPQASLTVDEQQTYDFVCGLNRTHHLLHENLNKQKTHNHLHTFEWFELAFDPENPNYMGVIFRPLAGEQAYYGATQMVMVKGATQVETALEDKEICALAQKLYASKTPQHAPKHPVALYAVGDFSDQEALALKASCCYNNVYANGVEVDNPTLKPVELPPAAKLADMIEERDRLVKAGASDDLLKEKMAAILNFTRNQDAIALNGHLLGSHHGVDVKADKYQLN